MTALKTSRAGLCLGEIDPSRRTESLRLWRPIRRPVIDLSLSDELRDGKNDDTSNSASHTRLGGACRVHCQCDQGTHSQHEGERTADQDYRCEAALGLEVSIGM